jgi:DNA-binding IclR family transcriptional regulator
MSDEELVSGSRSVAAPSSENEGKKMVAIYVSVPASHVSRQEPGVDPAPKSMNRAREVSLALGASF